MNPEKKDDRSESYFMVGGSQVTLRSGGIWLGPAGPLGRKRSEKGALLFENDPKLPIRVSTWVQWCLLN